MNSIFQILGGLGVFLFGLRVMSNGLQKLAGNRLRAVLDTLTFNRVTGIFSGFLITAAVQSSSATTVLIVSFANAGLLSLVQAIGLVMGANIGTTITGWLVSLLGFKIKISAFALPIIGIGFPLSLLESRRARHLSEALVGFGLLFLGLEFLKHGVPNLKSNPDALAWLQHFTEYGIGSVMLFVLVGAVLTIIVQSSSAAMAVTLAMAAEGWIDYEIAAAMILGENIGTTITATLAAIGANRTAKRVARSHTLFNVFGVLWMVPLMGVFLGFVDTLIPGDPVTDAMARPTHLAAFHTIFNITNTFLLVWFVKHIAAVVYKLVPVTQDEREAEHLRFLDTGLVATPELATVEVRRALETMAGVCKDTFAKVEEVITHPAQKLGPVTDEVKRGEVRTDRMEEEVVEFCTQLAREATSAQVSRNITSYLDIASDLESVGDHCFNLVCLAERRYDKKYVFDEKTQAELTQMLSLVTEFLALAKRRLGTLETAKEGEGQVLESKIDKLRDQTRKRHARRMQDGEVGIREGLIFLDMMTNMEKVGDYCYSIVREAERLADADEA
jgi:phosphate:Na+ symporter